MHDASQIFDDLFILEIANNHWGSVARGKQIIDAYAALCGKYHIKAAVKFQFRDVSSFVHKAFLHTAIDNECWEVPGTSTRYIKKTLATRLTWDEVKELVNHTKMQCGMLTMATPFDEASVSKANELGVDIIKIGSMNAISWPLIEAVCGTRKATVVSNGGTALADLDRVVLHFENNKVPLGINHCVSIYPSENHDIALHQIEVLRRRYPRHVIGFSAHDYHDVATSHIIAYSKGARLFERHVDISCDHLGKPVAHYNLTPEVAEQWFQAHHKVKEMLGPEIYAQRLFSAKETSYIKSVVRGVYAARDLPKGHALTRESLGKDYYLAIPLQEGQASERDLEVSFTLEDGVSLDEPLMKRRLGVRPKDSFRFTCIIPIRFHSSRFPGKPLHNIQGKPMVLWVAKHAHAAQHLSRVVVATDDSRIAECCRENDIEFVMTSVESPNGSARVAEAVQRIGICDQYVLEMQGDQPLVTPGIIDDFVSRSLQAMMLNSEIDVVIPFAHADDAATTSADVLKVVRTAKDRLVFQTRAPIKTGWRTLGLYLWNTAVLASVWKLPVSDIERAEESHPIRLYINDYYVHGILLEDPRWVEVDRRDQIGEVEKIMKDKGIVWGG